MMSMQCTQNCELTENMKHWQIFGHLKKKAHPKNYNIGAHMVIYYKDIITSVLVAAVANCQFYSITSPCQTGVLKLLAGNQGIYEGVPVID